MQKSLRLDMSLHRCPLCLYCIMTICLWSDSVYVFVLKWMYAYICV